VSVDTELAVVRAAPDVRRVEKEAGGSATAKHEVINISDLIDAG
jgi:hypothetical protein